jgi:hypothetical protein
MNQTITALVESKAEEKRLLEEECTAKVTAAMNQLEAAGRKLRKLEAEKALSVSNCKEAEALKLKNSDLEEKIRRQDHYMKSRLLKDKTNLHSSSSALCAPVPSEPSYRPPSARALSLTAGPTAATAAAAPLGDGRAVKTMR